MYPSVSDMLRDWFGINVMLPIQSYGLMMALAFVFGAWISVLEMKRKEKQGLLLPVYIKEVVGERAKPSELIITFLISFYIGMKVFWAFEDYDTFSKNPEYFLLSLKGNYFGGFIVALGYTIYVWWDKEKKKLPKPKIVYKKTQPHELLPNIIVVAGIWGVIGAKVFDAISNYQTYRTFELFTNFKEAWPTFKYMFFSFSGLAFLGGFVFGTIAVSLYIKKYNLNFLQMTDVAALALPLAYAIGRIGCQVSGDGCWGIPNPNPKPDWLSFIPDWAWSYDYPHNILGQAAQEPQWGIFVEKIPDCQAHCFKLATPVYPTPLYETTIMFLVFLFLWSIRKKIKIPGVLFSLYLILAGLERFFIEFIRHNNRYHIFGYELSQAQIISLFMIITGIAALVYIYFNKEKVLQWATPKPKDINKEPKKS